MTPELLAEIRLRNENLSPVQAVTDRRELLAEVDRQREVLTETLVAVSQEFWTDADGLAKLNRALDRVLERTSGAASVRPTENPDAS